MVAMLSLEYYVQQLQDKEDLSWLEAKRNLPPCSVSTVDDVFLMRLLLLMS